MKFMLLVSYGAAIAGLVLLGLAIFGAIERTLTYPDTRLRITNLLRTNANQAELLCKTLPGSFIAAVGAAVVAGGMVVGAPINVVTMSTRPAFDGAAIAVTLGWKQVVGRGKMGALAAGGGLALQAKDGNWPVLLIIFAVVAGGALVWLLLAQHEAERCVVLARAELLPEVDSAIVGRRYVPATKP